MADPQIRAIMAELERLVARTMASLALNVHSELVVSTPVDTGWARANWVPSVGVPFEETAGTREQAQAGSVNQGPSSAGSARVLGYTLDQGTIFISNNVPYIVFLNDGSSAQAPAGFVQAAVEKGLRTIETLPGL